MPIKFLYFDLGKVLVEFTVERMFRQMGEVARIEPAKVQEVVFKCGLQTQFETGKISPEEFYASFCNHTNTRPDYDALLCAGREIFELNASVLPVVAQLRQAGYRLGVLSNTCISHWEYCRRRFRGLLETFEVQALSFRIGALKPEAAIFLAAAELAGTQPQEIFFVDDTPGHVAGAKAAGFDAVQYTSTPQLVAELQTRGIRLNY